jgi:class 3 adenylate cyclase
MTTNPTRLPVEIAHILFIDLVSYSQHSMEEQARLVNELGQLTRSAPELQRAEASDDLICLDRGDGMALVFFRDPISPVQCAIEIARMVASRPNLRLRMGVNSGPVSRVVDINGKPNVSGDGINMA